MLGTSVTYCLSPVLYRLGFMCGWQATRPRSEDLGAVGSSEAAPFHTLILIS